MNELLTNDEGVFLVQLARQTIETYVKEQRVLENPSISSKSLFENRGVFVTIKKLSQTSQEHLELRGCIGRLQPPPNSKIPPIPLLEATKQAAISSAMEDPRFPVVRLDELDVILIEVSVLTVPKEIVLKEKSLLPQQITVGKDGLIVEYNTFRRGLLLPQVAPEQGWNAEEFLQGCCMKAGLPPDKYLDSRVKVFKFQAQIFAETSPRGEIIEQTFQESL
ncbi:MAG: TIGR00296 family protein [Promethearchaeota archaeon]